MSTENKEKIYGRYFSILCGIVIIACTFLPWVIRDGRNYTIYEFIMAVNGGEMEQFAAANPGFYPTYGLTYFSLISIVFCVIRVVMLLFNKKKRMIDNIMFFSQVIFFIGYVIFQGYNSGIGLLLVMALIFTDFLVVLYCEQSYEIHMRYFQMKKREREEKAERKRRLYFPGQYPKEFGRVIRENFVSKWKNYVLFIMTGVLSSTFLTVVIGMNFMLGGVHTTEDLVLGTGMQKILISAVGLILFTTVFLTSFVFSYYIKSRISDYKMFSVMGIRSRTLSIIMAAEYAGSLIAALLMGMIAGSGVLVVIRHIMMRKFGTNAAISGFTPAIYLCAVIGYVVILAFATAINHESYIMMRDAFTGTEYVDKQKVPRRFLIFWILVGLNWLRESIVGYSEISLWNAVVFLTGACLVIIMGRALWMKWEENSPRYYKHVLEKIPFYYRFKKSSRYLILLTVIHFCVLGIYLVELGSNLIAVPEENLVPYDFVLMAHKEDDAALEKIETDYQAEVNQYPMYRVTAAQGSAFGFMAFMVQYNPPGQYIGISETTYTQLCRERGITLEKPLGLGEKEIHVVIQQDSSFKLRPLDIGSKFETPTLAIGNPGNSFEYETWDVKSHEIAILTGMLQRGAQENLVVFSDKYFEEAYAKIEGQANNLCLVNVPKENYKAVDAVMSELREEHKQDENYDYDIRVYYGKQEMVNDIISERYTKEVLYAFVLFMLAASAWFLTYIKFSFDAEEMRQRYRFLEDMGMHEKEKLRTIRKEMWPFARIPLLVSASGAVIFTILLFRVRMYQPEQILHYIKTAGVIGAVYIVIQLLWMCWLVQMIQKKTR